MILIVVGNEGIKMLMPDAFIFDPYYITVPS